MFNDQDYGSCRAKAQVCEMLDSSQGVMVTINRH
jgi:hypothetical protein